MLVRSPNMRILAKSKVVLACLYIYIYIYWQASPKRTSNPVEVTSILAFQSDISTCQCVLTIPKTV